MMAGKPDVRVYADAEKAAAGLGEYTAAAAASAIAAHGAFSLGIAGGSLVKMLAGMKGVAGIEWDKWHVFWVDERCVPHGDPESNFGGADKVLLQQVPIPKANIHAIDDSLCQKNEGASGPAAAEYDARLKALPPGTLPRGAGGLPAFDLDDRWILPISDSPKPPPERITFSLPVVNAAARVCFVGCGAGKAEMSHVILDTAPAAGAIPAAMVATEPAGRVTWVLDEPAAAQVTSAVNRIA